MDPNAALENLRRYAAILVREPFDSDIGIQMSEAFNDLDLWLNTGGFYPQDWKKAYLDQDSEKLRFIPGHIRREDTRDGSAT